MLFSFVSLNNFDFCFKKIWKGGVSNLLPIIEKSSNQTQKNLQNVNPNLTFKLNRIYNLYLPGKNVLASKIDLNECGEECIIQG